MLGISRYTYNKTVELLQDGAVKASWKSIKTAIIQALPEWSKDAPYQVRSIAVRDACTYKCKSCGLLIHRDLNGARNILLRAMVDQPAIMNVIA